MKPNHPRTKKGQVEEKDWNLFLIDKLVHILKPS